MVTNGPSISESEGGSESVPQAQASQAGLLRLAATLGDGELRLLYRRRNGGDASNFSRKELVQWAQEQEDGAELQEAAEEVQAQASLILGSSGGGELGNRGKPVPAPDKSVVSQSKRQVWRARRLAERERLLEFDGVQLKLGEGEDQGDDPLRGELTYVVGKWQEISVKTLATKLGLSARRIIDLNSEVFQGLDEVHKFTAGFRVWVESDEEGSDDDDCEDDNANPRVPTQTSDHCCDPLTVTTRFLAR